MNDRMNKRDHPPPGNEEKSSPVFDTAAFRQFDRAMDRDLAQLVARWKHLAAAGSVRAEARSSASSLHNPKNISPT
jgi:hypothetical protein